MRYEMLVANLVDAAADQPHPSPDLVRVLDRYERWRERYTHRRRVATRTRADAVSEVKVARESRDGHQGHYCPYCRTPYRTEDVIRVGPFQGGGARYICGWHHTRGER